jgi:protein-S-isoprenylcysteine O-methyltransferase Ste14
MISFHEPGFDGLIYGFHLIFWCAFFMRALRRHEPPALGSATASASTSPTSRSASRAGIVFSLHGFGFGLMYYGIGRTVYGPPTSRLFALHWSVGAAVILLGAAIVGWALYVFDSWRFLAKLDAGHRLCTRGPYRYARHPIYLSCDLLAIGSFLWLPTVLVGLGMVVMLITGHLRACAEEGVLRETFGEEYRRYEGDVKRYLPGVF